MKNRYVSSAKRHIVLDVGSRGGLMRPWVDFDRSLLFTIGVDADEGADIDRCGDDAFDVVIRGALSDSSGPGELYLTESPGASSLLKPAIDFLSRYPDSGRFNIVENRTLMRVRLDEELLKLGIERLDFAKIDVQGYAFNVLVGFGIYLNKVSGLEVEAEHMEMYLGEQTFSSIDQYIRENSYLRLWDMRNVRWRMSPESDGINTRGRLIYSDCLYLIPPEHLVSWLSLQPKQDQQQMLSGLIYNSIAFGYPDYIQYIVNMDLSGLNIDINEIKKQCKTNRFSSTLRRIIPKSYWISWLLRLLAVLTYRPQNGWSSGRGHIGNRRIFGFWI